MDLIGPMGIWRISVTKIQIESMHPFSFAYPFKGQGAKFAGMHNQQHTLNR